MANSDIVMKIVCLFSAIASLALSIPTLPTSPRNVKWCTISDAEQAKCEALSQQLIAAAAANSRPSSIGIQCEQRPTKGRCMWDIGQGTLDVVNIGPREFYFSGKWYGLIPVVGENTLSDEERREGDGDLAKPFGYKSVVVLRRNSPIQSIEALRGAKSCHTFYGRHAGWAIPVSFLNVKGLLSSHDCLSSVDAVSKFFSEGCAAGSQDSYNNILGEDVSNLCALCQGNVSTRCTINDPFAGYEGSFKCLRDGQGDVSFTKHVIVPAATQGETEVGRRAQDFELLCPDGSKRNIDEYHDCNWAVVPPAAVVSSPHLNQVHRNNLRDLLLNLGQLLPSFNPFESISYGGNDLLFSDKTRNLFNPRTEEYIKYIGRTFVRTMENTTVHCDSSLPSTMRWCVVSAVEIAKCHQMQIAFETGLVKPKVQCIPADSTKDCMAKIRDGIADLITLDGGDIYTAGKLYGLIPIMYEDYGQHSAKYWAVAVAKKSDQTVSFPNLSGRKTCHTAVGRTAGWNVPISMLGARNEIQLNNPCNILRNVALYFSASCAPGALDFNADVPVSEKNNLCALCKGEGSNKCARKADEPYFGYTGAFRCLVEGGGDVAFVNHLTVLENTNGKNQDSWAKELNADDFELLCEDGTRRPVDQYEQCHLAKVPAHAVVTANSKTPKEIKAFVNALLNGQNRYGNDDNPRFRMFDSAPDGKNVLFRDATQRLVELPAADHNYEHYLGNYIHTAMAVDISECRQ